MSQRHLSDDRLIEICLAGAVAASADPHLARCEACEHRHTALVRMLGDIDAAATADADEAFSEERLVRQRQRILHRVDQEGRPGRVIAFPAARAATTSLLRSRPATRWAAATAAAAFVMGLLAGHFAHEIPGTHPGDDTPRMVANEAGATTLRAVSTTLSDEEFLGQIEMAVDSTSPAVLRPLDALTPRAWEVR